MLPDTFWMVRRVGAEDWEIVTDPALAAGIANNEHFEVEECKRSAALPVTHPVQLDTLEFHGALDLTIGDSPALRDEDLRADLILEEAAETAESITGNFIEVIIHDYDRTPDRPKSLAGAIDGLCDLLCVIYGAAISFGIDLAPFWDEVHRTNMAKAGGPKRADGKQLKPDGWEPPDIAGLLARLYPGALATTDGSSS